MGTTTEEVAIRLSAKDDGGSSTVRKLRGEVQGLEADSKKVTASTLNWSGAYRQLNRDTQGAQQSLNRMVDRGVIGLAALTGGAVAWGLKTASSYELSRSALGALLGDVTKGNTLFNQLQQYNLDSPFDFSGVASAEQTLLQFGVSGDKALSVLKGLGDVASLTAAPTQNLQSMAVALGQINSAGVMRAQDMNQLVQAGFPAYQLLAEISGKTSAQLRKDMETGLTLPASQFVGAVENMQGAVLAKYKGGALKQNETLQGQWSNFKDLMARNLEKGIRPSLPEIKKELPILAESFADAIDRLGPQLPGLVTSLVQLAPAAIDLTEGFAGLLAEVVPIVADVADLLGPTGVKVLLGVLLGYRALTGAAAAVTTFSSALKVLRGVEAGTGVGAGVGTGAAASGGKLSRGLGTAAVAVPLIGMGVDNAAKAYQHPDPGKDGFGVSAFLGGSVGLALKDASHRVSQIGHVGKKAYDATGGFGFGSGSANHVDVGGIIVHNPTSNVDVSAAVETGIHNAIAAREARR